MLSRATFLVIIISLLAQSKASKRPKHVCIHDHTVEQYKHEQFIAPQRYDLRSQKRQQGGPYTQPYRIKYMAMWDDASQDDHTCKTAGSTVMVQEGTGLVPYTCQEDDIMTAQKSNFLLDILVNESAIFYNEALNVIPISGNLMLRTNPQTCGGIPIPDSFRNPGVSDADFVLFIRAHPIPCATQSCTLAFATTCGYDISPVGGAGGRGRPLIGFVNFNPKSLSLDESQRAGQVGLAKHEIAHAIGFSRDVFENSQGLQTYNTQMDIWEHVPADQITKTETVASGKSTKSVTKIITPTVVSFVRDHFDCPTLDGAELEDGGGSGTALSHWEKRLFFSEYMTGTAERFPVKSLLTLGALQDTGWYQAKPEAAETLGWGAGAGCNFATGDCGLWDDHGTGTVNGFKCTSNSAFSTTGRCTADQIGYGPCNIGQISNLPEEYQHFNDPQLGGQNDLADYCAFYHPSQFCATDDGSRFEIADSGQARCESCRCFQSSLASTVLNIAIPQNSEPRCYNITCVSSTQLRVMVNLVWYDCIQGANIKPLGYGGNLLCASGSIKRLCAAQTTTDTEWPTFTSITPQSGPPETRVNITGTNFNKTDMMEVYINHAQMTDVVVHSDTLLSATLPTHDSFVSVTRLFGNQRDYVFVRDAQTRTAFIDDAFKVTLPSTPFLSLLMACRLI